jgi:predicted RNA-binding Zn-ribbon protein involved in translation (DUF1610 family)
MNFAAQGGLKKTLVPHTCTSCGHVYGENNAFVLKTQCCPICGAKIRLSRKGRQYTTRIAMLVVFGLIISVIYFIANHLMAI